MFVPAYSASQPFVFVLSCGIRVASVSSVDSIPFLNGVLILRCKYQSFMIIDVVMLILFNRRVFSPSGSDHFNIHKIKYQFFSTLFVSSISKLPLFFPPSLPLFFSKDPDSYSSIHFIGGNLSILFPSIFLSGDSHVYSNGASSSSLFTRFLLRWFKFKRY